AAAPWRGHPGGRPHRGRARGGAPQRCAGHGHRPARVGVADPRRTGRGRTDHDRPQLPPGPRLREHRREALRARREDPPDRLTPPRTLPKKAPRHAGLFIWRADRAGHSTDVTFRSIASLPSLRCRIRAGTGMPSTTQAIVCLSPSVLTSLVAWFFCPPTLICSVPATL